MFSGSKWHLKYFIVSHPQSPNVFKVLTWQHCNAEKSKVISLQPLSFSHFCPSASENLEGLPPPPHRFSHLPGRAKRVPCGCGDSAQLTDQKKAKTLLLGGRGVETAKTQSVYNFSHMSYLKMSAAVKVRTVTQKKHENRSQRLRLILLWITLLTYEVWGFSKV